MIPEPIMQTGPVSVVDETRRKQAGSTARQTESTYLENPALGKLPSCHSSIGASNGEREATDFSRNLSSSFS